MVFTLGIIGIGNPLMRDDGIGLVVLNMLREHEGLTAAPRYPDHHPSGTDAGPSHPPHPPAHQDPPQGTSPDIRFIELGTGGMNLLHHLARLHTALIIDSGNMGLPPGEFRTFSPEDVRSVKFLPGQSLHEFDLLQAIAMSERLGECPPLVRILAIQPESVGWGEGLSAALRRNLDRYVTEAVHVAHALLEAPPLCHD